MVKIYTPLSDQKGFKWKNKHTHKENMPFGAAHFYIAYVREYPSLEFDLLSMWMKMASKSEGIQIR